jgi:hypothetical protein
MTKYTAWFLSVGAMIVIAMIGLMQFSSSSQAQMNAEYFDGPAPWDGYVPTVRIMGNKRVYQFFMGLYQITRLKSQQPIA